MKQNHVTGYAGGKTRDRYKVPKHVNSADGGKTCKRRKGQEIAYEKAGNR